MDTLIPEILSLIIAELFAESSAESPRPANYAAISCRWQHLVETHTFASIKLRLNEQEMSTFASAFKGPRRQTLLRTLYLSFEPPVQGNRRAGHVENSAALGSALTSLFKLLSRWETDDRTLEVLFSIPWPNLTPARRFLMLDQSETVLTAVRCVSYLRISSDPGRALHPTASCKVAAHLPNLKWLELKFHDPKPKRAQLRKEIRKAMATSLNSLELPVLERLEMVQESSLLLCNHGLECGDLRDEDGVDLLNDAVLNFSQRTPIKQLHLKNFLVSSELFTGMPESSWPNLQQFYITGGAVALSGEWYWAGDPASMTPGSTRGYGSDASSSVEYSSDSDTSWYMYRDRDDSGTEDDSERDAIVNGYRPMYEWRDTPDWDMLVPLLVDMARAVQRMPNLQRGHLLLGKRGSGDISVQCAAAGFCYSDWDKYQPKSFRTCRFFVGEPKRFFMSGPIPTGTLLSLSEVPDEVRSAWREWLGDDGVFEIGEYWFRRAKPIL